MKQSPITKNQRRLKALKRIRQKANKDSSRAKRLAKRKAG